MYFKIAPPLSHALYNFLTKPFPLDFKTHASDLNFLIIITSFDEFEIWYLSLTLLINYSLTLKSLSPSLLSLKDQFQDDASSEGKSRDVLSLL